MLRDALPRSSRTFLAFDSPLYASAPRVVRVEISPFLLLWFYLAFFLRYEGMSGYGISDGVFTFFSICGANCVYVERGWYVDVHTGVCKGLCIESRDGVRRYWMNEMIFLRTWILIRSWLQTQTFVSNGGSFLKLCILDVN